jgi:uncharacterized membrane protein YwzB
MASIKQNARIAGLLYLFIIVTGYFSLMYVPGKLFVRGDAAATAARILASESLFRFDIVNGLVSSIGFLFLALALYRLLKSVNTQQARLMAILVLIQVPLATLTAVNQLAALELMRGADYLSVFDKPQRDALAMVYLHLNTQGTIASEIFWGLWLLPLGALVFRSGFLPRFLGVWLVINCFAYFAVGLTGLLAPQYLGTVNQFAFPFLMGEVAFALWLLVVGARPGPRSALAPRAA